MQYTAEIHTRDGFLAVAAMEDAASGAVLAADRVRIVFDAADNYTARTRALAAANAAGAKVGRIRAGRAMFAGAWYDLFEDEGA